MAAKYKIVRSINRGGMAEVFEGVVQGVGTFARRVAIKRLLHYQSPSELAAFADEARLVAQLDHPNIVSVFDYGAVDGQPFQVLELVDGLDLKELVELGRQRTYPVPVEAALLIVAQVARALDYAHRAADNQGHALGIVHRDVTPHNILVSWAGHVKLADFGIAMAKDRGAVTEPGIVKGKLSFMAPEYLLGGAVTPLADVFALGCVLHFAIAGVSPYGTEDARRNGARGMAPPLDPTVPDDVARLVTRACHPIPEQRCASAIDLAVAAEKTLARRAGTGAMRMLTDWLQELRSRSAPAPAQRLAQLFQLEPTGYEGDSGLVRFQSIPARPAPEPAAEEIEPDPALPTSPDDTTRGGLDFLRTEVNGASMATLAPMPEPTLPSAPSVSPPSQDGKLGGYAILATLREAGRGQLLLARPREPQPGRPQVVMLKVWPAEVSRDLSFIALVTREATLRKQLTDEHLPRVLDMGVDDGRLVVELDYPLGRTLRQIVDRIRRPLAAEEVAALGVGLARGLVAGRNLREALGADFSRVPCELTPDKVFITYEGTPIVTDFAVRSAAERMLDEDWVRVTEDVARRREVWTLVNTLQGLLTDKDNRRAQTLSARISKIADSAPSHRAAKELASTLSGFVQEPARIVQGLMEELYAETARRERQVLMRLAGEMHAELEPDPTVISVEPKASVRTAKTDTDTKVPLSRPDTSAIPPLDPAEDLDLDDVPEVTIEAIERHSAKDFGTRLQRWWLPAAALGIGACGLALGLSTCTGPSVEKIEEGRSSAKHRPLIRQRDGKAPSSAMRGGQ